MKQKKNSKVAVLTIFALIIALFAAVPAMAKTNGKLVKNYKWQWYDSEAKTWNSDGMKYDLTQFTYNKKGDPVKIKKTRYFTNGKKQTQADPRKIKFKYKKGVKKSSSEVFDVGQTKTSYKKGVPVSIITDDDGYKYINKYKVKNYYATYRFNETFLTEDHNKSTTKYKTKFKKGLPVSITWKNDTYSGASYFYKKGNKKGLIQKIVYENPYTKTTSVYTYKIKKGRVYSVVQSFTGYDKDEKKTSTEKERMYFTYTKKAIKAKRYLAMMNGLINGTTNPVSRMEGEELYGNPTAFISCWF